MKKLTLVVSVLVLMAFLLLSACSAGPRTQVTTPAATQYVPVPTVTVAVPSATSAYRPPPTAFTPVPTAPNATRPPVTATAGPSYPRPTVIPSPVPTSGYYPPAITVAPTTTVPGAGGYYPPAPTPTGYIGLATGGAKDVANFRENIRTNYLPLPTDVTYEGLFYDYFFDTGQREPSNKLFAPSYSYAVTRDPLSHQTEYYLSVGLNSGLKASDFERKRLNLVIVLDTSGSMGESFDRYYYDQTGRIDPFNEDEGGWQTRKMDSAKQSVLAILDQLTRDDRFAIVTFNSNARLEKPMGYVSQTDMRRVREQVMNIYAGGSTNLDAGLDMANGQFSKLYEMNNYEFENRVIVLTDAQPNTGDTGSVNFSNTLRRNAESRIYTTAIGIGVDFNSQLIEEITKTKGANYYSVHSPREFRQRVEDEFEFMVTPLVFNVQMDFSSRGWAIDRVFGSPEADRASGRLLTINTLFPSKSEGGETRGGLVLLKLRKTSSSPGQSVYLKVTYEDRNGRRDSSEEVINLEAWQPESFDNTGIRKGVLLTRYAALLKNWLADERQNWQVGRPWDPAVSERTGIIIPPDYSSQWERQSLPLTVSEPYKRLFRDFAGYFQSEIRALEDNDLYQELDTLNYLGR